MDKINWGKLIEQFVIRKNSNGYISALSFMEYCERAKQLAAKKYEKILIIGNGEKETERTLQTDAIGFVGYEPNTKQVILLAGSLIRSMEDYKFMHEINEYTSATTFSKDALEKRQEIEKESIRIFVGNKQYTMVLKDTTCKSLNVASAITYLSHNDYRRRYESDLSKYRYERTKFELKTKRLEGLNLRIKGKCIGQIKGNYVVDKESQRVVPIDRYLKYRDELTCGIYTFDFIYKETD